MRRVVAALLVILLATPALPAWAQEVSPALLAAARQAYQQGQQKQPEILAPVQAQSQVAPASEADWNSLRQLLVGERIAVKTKDNITHTGDFVAYSDEAISLREGKREVAYRREEVLGVSLLGARKRSKWALIGFLVGFGVGAGVGALFVARLDVGTQTVVAGGASLGGIGAGVGAGVARRSQTVVYRAGP